MHMITKKFISGKSFGQNHERKFFHNIQKMSNYKHDYEIFFSKPTLLDRRSFESAVVDPTLYGGGDSLKTKPSGLV